MKEYYFRKIGLIVRGVLKGKTTYYIVVKDRQAYIQRVPNRIRRLLLRMNTRLISDSITNIDISSIATDQAALFAELNRRIS